MSDASPSYATRPPNRIGGALALDFVNTVEWRGDPAAHGERLTSYGELAHWAGHAGAAPQAAVPALLAEAARRPAEAAAIVEEATRLREATARLLARPDAPRPEDLALLNVRLAAAGPPQVAAHGAGLGWSDPPGDPLAAPLAAVARDAADLLTSPRRARVRVCADPRCAWMFLDADRGPGRRWCSMADCGNRAKARRHYRRRKDTAGD